MATEVEIRAEQARQVLSNPVFESAFYGLQVGVIDQIATTDPKDEKQLAMLALKLQVCEDFKAELLGAVETQQLEADNLASMNISPEPPSIM